jgi:hypothetical protein
MTPTQHHHAVQAWTALIAAWWTSHPPDTNPHATTDICPDTGSGTGTESAGTPQEPPGGR